ncbi:MAG TPA: alpha/beta hydrolase-fold protein [Solirubrobacteraceae bacterium]|nr:alpha/beta hydrolase-fold protein [Solirubrobacteraceae bacterium]
MKRYVARHPAVVAMVIATTVIGLVGAYSYWESYYQHRGFAPVAFLPHARPGQRVVVRFYSQALHREADYLVYLPPGYGNGERYPVYYLLHGSPGRPEVFWGIASMPVRMDNLISQHRMRPMILVFPDGRIGGSAYSDSEWANTPSGDYADYVIDVVHDVDHRFDTIANRDDRVIAGFSMGAYGATNILLQNLTVFGNLQSWSGYYIQTRSGVFAHASQATLNANSPLRYVHTLRAAIAADPVRAFMFVGRDDNDSPQLEPMAEALAAAGGQVTFALYRGGHDWQLWHGHLDPMLELASRDTARPLKTSSGSIRSLTPGVVPIPHGLGRHRHARVVTAGAYATVVVSADRVRHGRHRRRRHQGHQRHHGRGTVRS